MEENPEHSGGHLLRNEWEGQGREEKNGEHTGLKSTHQIRKA